MTVWLSFKKMLKLCVFPSLLLLIRPNCARFCHILSMCAYKKILAIPKTNMSFIYVFLRFVQKTKKIDRPVFALWLVLLRYLASFPFFASSNWPNYRLIQSCLFICARKKYFRDIKIWQTVQTCIVKICAKIENIDQSVCT